MYPYRDPHFTGRISLKKSFTEAVSLRQISIISTMTSLIRFRFVLPLLLLAVSQAQGAIPEVTQKFRSDLTHLTENKSGESDTERLHKFFELQWNFQMKQSPETATWNGQKGENHRWTDYSEGAIEVRKATLPFALRFIKSIDRSKLSPDDQLNYDLMALNHNNAKKRLEFPEEFLIISQMNGVQREVPMMLGMMPAQSASELEDIISRIRKLPTLIDQHIALMDRGLKKGITPPKITVRDLALQAQKQLEYSLEESPILKAFHKRPALIDEDRFEKLKQEAADAWLDGGKKAFAKLHSYLKDTYVPGCREKIGMSAMPNGKKWYALRASLSTTTYLTPDEIHQIGLNEVKRIRGEMEKIRKDTGFKGDLQAFFEFLRTDKQFFHESARALLAGYRDIAKRADPEISKLFGKLPRSPYGIRPIPSYAEKSQTTAYYMPGSTDAGRPGYFYANTYDLSSRPIWEMEALTLHEAVPGHHLQLALADELEDVPNFRRKARYTAYIEGWGLYSESLGHMMGFYEDPYSHFGALTYEMWRAIRLVVDTGLHAKGWTRQQAIDYFKENAGKSEHDITVEVDRYIVWPGQALAYKIGQLKIMELRDSAQKELGDAFDIRSFHDTILESGAVPLSILEKRINAWIDRSRP